MSKGIPSRRLRGSLSGGVSLLALLCSSALAAPPLPAIDIGGQQAPDSGKPSPPPTKHVPNPRHASSHARSHTPIRARSAGRGGSAQHASGRGGPPLAAPHGPPMDGSAEAGYRVKETTAAGPIFGNLPLQDAPYSITVVPSPMIENLQAYQPEDIWRVIPQITNNNTQQNSSGNPFAYVRGFSITQFTNQAGVTYDGLLGGAGGMFSTVLEDKERVELLSGTSGFL